MALILNMINSMNPLAHTHLRSWFEMILTACPIPNRHTIPKHWQFHWPTLVELNDKFDPYLWQNEEERGSFMKDDAPFSPHISYTGLPPFPP